MVVCFKFFPGVSVYDFDMDLCVCVGALWHDRYINSVYCTVILLNHLSRDTTPHLVAVQRNHLLAAFSAPTCSF